LSPTASSSGGSAAPRRPIFQGGKPQEFFWLWLTPAVSRGGAHHYTRRRRLHGVLDRVRSLFEVVRIDLWNPNRTRRYPNLEFDHQVRQLATVYQDDAFD